MNTQTNAQVDSNANPAPIKDVKELAPVVPSGTPGITVTDKTVSLYCDQVIAGKPTGKIFPAKLSEITFTEAQREMIRGARAEHKLNCMNAKKTLLAIVRSKNVETVGHRTNRDGTMGAIRYANRSKITHSFIFGAEKKA